MNNKSVAPRSLKSNAVSEKLEKANIGKKPLPGVAAGQVVLHANGGGNERGTGTQRQATFQLPSMRLHSRMVPFLATHLAVPRGTPNIFPNFMRCPLCRRKISPLDHLQQNQPASPWINPHPRLWYKARSPETSGSCHN